jgi:hypothetical protein
VNRKCKRLAGMWLAHVAIAALVALIAAGLAGAADRRNERLEFVASRTAGDPIMAIVSLHSQRITVYDANGWILRAPVSSGRRERETPAGIFGVIQKDADHHSNLYDDAFMPHMQRLTWSGIALHGGPLPGYPASHGCIRMPFDFAERLFAMTELGLRVIVAPTDVAPAEMAHPVLLFSKPGAGALAAARTAEADEASRKADQARFAAGKAFREATQAMVPVRAAETLKLRADAQLVTAETALGAAISTETKKQAERDKEQPVKKITDLEVQLAAAKAELQLKLNALATAREAAVVAETAQVAAAEAAREVAGDREPVSVLISRKTQRLYVRQGFEPVLDVPVTILDPDRPIGTHIFTAVERTNGETNMRWNVVSLRRRSVRRRGRVTGPGWPGPWSRRRADACRSRQCKERARPHCHPAGRVGSSRRDSATIFAHHHRRSIEFRDRQRYGFCGYLERRAARRTQDPTTQPESGGPIPLRFHSRSPA